MLKEFFLCYLIVIGVNSVCKSVSVHTKFMKVVTIYEEV